jgi:hypothetical protein
MTFGEILLADSFILLLSLLLWLQGVLKSQVFLPAMFFVPSFLLVQRTADFLVSSKQGHCVLWSGTASLQDLGQGPLPNETAALYEHGSKAHKVGWTAPCGVAPRTCCALQPHCQSGLAAGCFMTVDSCSS